jgi:CBS domain-containing protein
MRELKINSFPVIDSSKKLVGAVNMFYIINAGVK